MIPSKSSFIFFLSSDDETYIQFDKKLNEDESVLVKVIYYMPETVGNEAQNAEANFDLRISSRHK